MYSKRFQLLSDKEHNDIWENFDRIINFQPSVDLHIIPFAFLTKVDYGIYDIKSIMESHSQEVWAIYERDMQSLFVDLVPETEFIYALDWQHSGFKLWPHVRPSKSEYETIQYKEPADNFQWEGYRAYYPTFLPDGDYYFFLSCDLSWGYLGHPWRQEIWLYGNKVIQGYEKYYPHLKLPIDKI